MFHDHNHYHYSKPSIHSRKLNNQTLVKYAQILEVLEVSQLMDTCVRNEYYEESLELLEYVARLERKLMHIPLIQVGLWLRR